MSGGIYDKQKDRTASFVLTAGSSRQMQFALKYKF